MSTTRNGPIGVVTTAALYAFGAVAVVHGQPPADGGPDPNLVRLEREIGRLAPRAGGTVGVAAIHLESDRHVYLNGDVRFPMASTYKIPIAIHALRLVDEGVLSLDSMVALQAGDLHPGSGILTELFVAPGVALSVRNLLELTLLISDNSATDVLLRTVGGSDAVNARLLAMSVEDIRVDRPTVELIGDWIGIDDLPPADEVSEERFRELARTVSRGERRAAARRFYSDARDTATPRGMAQLLTALWTDGVLSDSSRTLLLDIMERSTTGSMRLKGHLPPETGVAHKTGTIGGTLNDVGIITLPGDAGHVVTVVFVKGSGRSEEDREGAIAHIARAIHDYFVFNSDPIGNE